MGGQDGLIGKELILDAGDLEVVFHVAGHVDLTQAFQMASGDDAGSQAPGRLIHEFIEQIILAGEEGR